MISSLVMVLSSTPNVSLIEATCNILMEGVKVLI